MLKKLVKIEACILVVSSLLIGCSDQSDLKTEASEESLPPVEVEVSRTDSPNLNFDNLGNSHVLSSKYCEKDQRYLIQCIDRTYEYRRTEDLAINRVCLGGPIMFVPDYAFYGTQSEWNTGDCFINGPIMLPLQEPPVAVGKDYLLIKPGKDSVFKCKYTQGLVKREDVILAQSPISEIYPEYPDVPSYPSNASYPCE